ncbi:hypothetical protein D3C84_828600 [compost metagenome]
MTDPCEQSHTIGIDSHSPRQSHPPLDQRHHGCNLQQQDQNEKRHFEVEQRLMQIIVRAFLIPAKRSHPAADQQRDCANTPHIVRNQNTARLARAVAQTPKRHATRQHRPQSQGNRQKMNRRQKPVSQHRETPFRTKLNQPVSSSP